jgi:RNA polymerase sigma-70 factor (ECF subfamily)
METTHSIVGSDVIDRARNGDRAALGELWRTYQPQVLRFLRATGAHSPDDTASDVWMDVGRSLHRFTGDGRAFQRWLFTIAHRRNIDEARRRTRRKESSIRIDEHRTIASIGGPGIDPDPLEQAISLVSSLPAQMAEAVMLRIVHDLSVEDVSAIMEISDVNVRVLTHRGLTKLRAQMRHERAADQRSSAGATSGVRFAATSATTSNENL